MCNFLKSTIGQKILMAISGVVLILFVLGHLLGNLQIFGGEEALNAYGHFLHTNQELLWPARIVILLAVVVHIWTSIKLSLHNQKTRPVAYKRPQTLAATIASRTMLLSGLVVLAFVLYHLAQFTFEITNPEYETFRDSTGRDDVYKMVVSGFQNIYVVSFYILAQILLALHLSHGFLSAPQTLGITHPLIQRTLRRYGIGLVILIALGYISIPVCVWTGIIHL